MEADPVTIPDDPHLQLAAQGLLLLSLRGNATARFTYRSPALSFPSSQILICNTATMKIAAALVLTASTVAAFAPAPASRCT